MELTFRPTAGPFSVAVGLPARATRRGVLIDTPGTALHGLLVPYERTCRDQAPGCLRVTDDRGFRAFLGRRPLMLRLRSRREILVAQRFRERALLETWRDSTVRIVEPRLHALSKRTLIAIIALFAAVMVALQAASMVVILPEVRAAYDELALLPPAPSWATRLFVAVFGGLAVVSPALMLGAVVILAVREGCGPRAASAVTLDSGGIECRFPDGSREEWAWSELASPAPMARRGTCSWTLTFRDGRGVTLRNARHADSLLSVIHEIMDPEALERQRRVLERLTGTRLALKALRAFAVGAAAGALVLGSVCWLFGQLPESSAADWEIRDRGPAMTAWFACLVGSASAVPYLLLALLKRGALRDTRFRMARVRRALEREVA
jgi:hypothetical protein